MRGAAAELSRVLSGGGRAPAPPGPAVLTRSLTAAASLPLASLPFRLPGWGPGV